MTEIRDRLWQLLALVEKEDVLLQGVITRLFGTGGTDAASEASLKASLETAEGIDRLESFVGKFSRMQDTVMDKLLPTFLQAVGEGRGTALDNLNRAQRLGFVRDPDSWLAMRLLRNRLVHEYVDDLAELAAALNKARLLAHELGNAYRAIRAYAEQRLQ